MENSIVKTSINIRQKTLSSGNYIDIINQLSSNKALRQSYFKTNLGKKPIFKYSNQIYAVPLNSSLGPGKYDIKDNRIPSPYFSFSKSKRFSNELDLASMHRKLTEESKKVIKDRVEKNKKIAVLPARARSEITKTNISKKNIRSSIAKAAKEYILDTMKSQKTQALNDKLKKFEYRMKISVFLT